MSETMSTSGIKDEGDDESEIVQTTPEQEFSSKNELDQLDRQRTDSRDADVSSGEDDKLQMRKVALKKRRNSQLSELSGAQGMTGLSLLHVNEQPINPQVQSFTEQNLPRPASWNYSTFGEAPSGASMSDQMSHRAETDTRSPLKNDDMEILNPEPTPSIKAPTIIPPTPALTSEQAAIMRRLSAHTIVPILPVGVFSPEPPSPDRLELKGESVKGGYMTFEPPSPGRLALKGIETDEEQNTDKDEDVMFPERSPGSGASDWSRPERPKVRKPAAEEDNAPINPGQIGAISLNLTTASVIAQQPVHSEFPQKDLKRLKLLSQKRTNLDSPTLREIANQNATAKRFRGEESEAPRLRSPMPRASPYQRTEEDQRSEAATVGDIDDLGSVASLSSITDAKAFETKENDEPSRPERISRPEPDDFENEGDPRRPWIESLKEKPFNFKSFKQLTNSRREYATRLDNYLRGCSWAPDGLCILSNSNDNILRLFNLPSGLLTGQLDNVEPEMKAILRIPEGEAIYDYSWWPLMNSMDPPTCCFVSTAKGQPIHLFDAFNGKLRATYRIINRLDEVATAFSVCFSHDGTRLYAGLDSEYRVFDTLMPGRDSHIVSLGKGYQGGIISTLVAQGNLIAAGSFNRDIALYDHVSDEQIVLLRHAHPSGITQIKFLHDNYFVSAARKSSDIKCWDMRNCEKPIWSVRRECDTNQKIQFDISPDKQMLVSGSTSGKLYFWNLGETGGTATELYQKPAHRSAANAVSFHPFAPVIASGSGQRVFPNVADSDSEDTLTATPVSDNALTLWTAFDR